jgi:small multidrug resistance pump
MMAKCALLLVAIVCEVTATTLLKASNGLVRPWHSVGVLAGYLGSLFLLAYVLKFLPVGPVYAVWAGLGTAGASVVGLVAYGERIPAGGWLGVGFVVAGVALLGFYAPHGS